MIDKNKVIDILKKHPEGLKAKEIAEYIAGADRKVINQILYSSPNLFLCNDKYEWSLEKCKTTTDSLHTKEEIVSYFPKASIDDEIFDLLKKRNILELELYSSRVADFFSIVPNVIKEKRFFTSAILVSEEQYKLIFYRTRELSKIHNVRQYDEWEKIILSEQFDDVCQRIVELKESNIFSHLITDYYQSQRWLEIVMLDKRSFKAFISRAKLLASIDEPLDDYRLSTYALDTKFTRLSRLEKILMLQQENNFPRLLNNGHQLFELLYLSASAFERCLVHAKKVYYQDSTIITQIKKYFTEESVLQILLLKEKEFNQLLVNVFAYKSSKFFDSFSKDQKIKWFSLEPEAFIQSTNNITTLEKAVCDKRILHQSDEELLRCMWLSEKQFQEEYDRKVYEKFDDERRRESISNTISYYNNNPLRQCTGDCSTCRREECPLDRK